MAEKCRDCALYDLKAVLSSKGRVLSRNAARCLWVSTEVWPLSVQTSFQSRPKPGYMQPNSGEGCPCFIAKDPSDA